MKNLIFLSFVSVGLAQLNNTDVDAAIKKVFSSDNFLGDFLKDYEEVTPPPLGSLSALSKCGEGKQLNRFVCVPYYNCDPDTKTVVENPTTDGTNKIDIRMRFGNDDNYKCDHYLEVCCQLPNNTGNGGTQNNSRPIQQTTTPRPTVTTSPSGSNKTIFCGIRNSNGLDFNLIGKSDEALFGEFPWMVAVLRKNPSRNQGLAICGGSLITPKVVLTGAHCVDGININDIKIRAGEWDTQTTIERIPYQERNVVEKIVRSDFIKGNLYNDVALLILDRGLVKADNVGTICLPKQNQFLDSEECFATGWGKDIFGQKGNYAVILKKIQVPLVQIEDCQRALRKTRLGNTFILHRSFICAGGEAGVDTCTGDGGSPLVCPDPDNPGRYVQAGIVAWGIGCGEEQIPGVYVDVTKFRNWIDTNLVQRGIRTVSYE